MSLPNVKDLLLAPRLDSHRVAMLLTPYGFKEPAKADANLQSMADDPLARQLLADSLEELLSCAAQSADPDQALNHFERFARAIVNKINLFSYLKESPRTIEILAKTFGGSQYMAEILIRDPVVLFWVTDPQILHQPRKKREMARDLLRALKTTTSEQKQLDLLRAFKRREMLHIGVRDLLRLCSVEETLSALSTLAELLISAAYRICETTLRRDCGVTRRTFGGFTVLGMGKLGGGELNFSSDVDLIYLYAADQDEAEPSESEPGPLPISASEYFRRLSQKITVALNEFTSEGYVYRVDLRLRPEGSLGNIAYSLSGFEHYYDSRGATWERLMLLKAWPVAGDRELGRKFLKAVQAFIYHRPFDLKALDEIKSMKKKIDRKMSASQQRRRNVKLGFGGIREIELIVQALQISYGGHISDLCDRHTLRALRALCRHALISDEEYEALSGSYLFLRDVENKLQMINDAQTHSIPTNPDELNTFARLLGYFDHDQDSASEQFQRDYQLQTNRVNQIFEKIFGASQLQRFR